MTIYRDSKRIVGTNADRVGTPAISGGWKLLGRNSGSLPSVTSLANKRYYMILNDVQVNTSAPAVGIRLGNSSSDTGTNYSDRYCQNDSSDVTETSQTRVQWHGDATTLDQFSVGYISNLSGKEKLMMNRSVSQGGSGAGTAPSNRWEGVGKWANTSNPLDRIDWFNIGSGSWDSSSEMVVLGWDPNDTHTDNFWEQLADINATGLQSSFNTGAFTAKKYLWIQFYWKATFTGAYTTMRVGNTTLDTGSNYAWRWSNNGGSDSTGTSKSDGWYPVSGQGSDSATGYYVFGNMFIINNAGNEKLGICHTNRWDGAGAGNANARSEVVVKWADTTNQIDIVGLERAGGSASGNYDSSSFIKVWGSN